MKIPRLAKGGVVSKDTIALIRAGEGLIIPLGWESPILEELEKIKVENIKNNFRRIRKHKKRRFTP